MNAKKYYPHTNIVRFNTVVKKIYKCRPVYQTNCFVDGNPSAAFLGESAFFVFQVHVALGEVTCIEIKVCRVYGRQFRIEHVLNLKILHTTIKVDVKMMYSA